ncbi:hypothetical protein PBNK65E_000497800 [Plasmodium berghei]|uniref:Fam-a protein n=1 Tax=Plasmodium berghei TaxID=5821 RepID=A0A0Y9VGH6_PLABE|nr:hypothetical protein PBK173_000118800 [Plasmodium berghei]SBW38151.1 hypothetical protein PBNK65E_000497800 [Plasmodium berghei]SCL81894.1 hypothetical protein PBSP11RLL_000495000 [Plasmodium berghei]SCL82185.1 hypothetical protein PBNK65NY_000492900 [Plasmodium berghei]SCL82436.1 hypothetical protein PBSP11A_000495100 [Plasmodium berghei]
MSKGYIKILLFVLSLIVYVNNTVFADNNTLGTINSNYAYPNNTTPNDAPPNNTTPNDTPPKKKVPPKKSSKKVPPKKLKPSDIDLGEIFRNIETSKFKHLILKSTSPISFLENDVRSCIKNLLMILKLYKNMILSYSRYFYALVKKAQTAIIAYAQADINDHNSSNKKYKNTIIKNTNLLKTDIDSEEVIRKGKLKKTFVNIIGYFIEKKDKHVDITYVDSIDGHASIYQKSIIRKIGDYLLPHK